MRKPVKQIFTDEYLSEIKEATPTQIARWLDDYRKMMSGESNTKSKLISMKVPQDLLTSFKEKAKLANTPYQTQIKKLMIEWLKVGSKK